MLQEIEKYWNSKNKRGEMGRNGKNREEMGRTRKTRDQTGRNGQKKGLKHGETGKNREKLEATGGGGNMKKLGKKLDKTGKNGKQRQETARNSILVNVVSEPISKETSHHSKCSFRPY